MVVVDTDVFSFIFKQDTRAALYQPHLSGHLLVLSFMTVAELDLWAVSRNWGIARKQRLEKTLRRYRVMESSRDLGKVWAAVEDNARRTGRPIAVPDAWIAATALHYGVPLVTHNAADYAWVPGLTVVTEPS